MGGKLLLSLPQDDVCNIYTEWKSDSGEFFITGYEGIPQNIVLNIFCAAGVVIGFSIARRVLWNYGRIALIERNIPRWREEYSMEKHDSSRIELSMDKNEYNSVGEIQNISSGPTFDDKSLGDTGLFSWIRITFILNEDFICDKCGPDAVLYLRYQRHLIFLSFFICICSIMIILPLHLQGDQLRDRRPYQPGSFAQSTLGNLPSDSPIIWVHSLMAFIYYIASVIVMRHFTRSLRPRAMEDDAGHRTVMILGIQQRMCHTEKIEAHIKEIYPNCVIDECTFAYDTSKLQDMENWKSSLLITMKHLQELHEKAEKRQKMRPYWRMLMMVFWWLCCVKEVDAIHYYSKEILKFKKLSDYERARTLGRPLGICFVTFQTAYFAERMIHDYNFYKRFWDFMISVCGPFYLDRTPQSRYGRKMRAREWFLYHAPAVNDIKWENFGLSLLPWFLKAIMINFTVVLLALFFSTPIILIKTINYYFVFRERGRQHDRSDGLSVGDVFYELFPTFLIWVAAVTLPSLVSVSDKMIGFWTTTAENQSRMIKTFSFLVTMVIILPSLGLSSILYTIGQARPKWECIYSPSNAAFFVNYVTTSCFLGTTSELWRFPELFYIVCKQLIKKSSYENPGIRAETLWEFQIGTQYAWMMLVFAVFSVFSLICPLITPLGVIYMTIKHFVDKHNIFFAYDKCTVDNSVHNTAVNFVTFCMLLLLVITYVYTNVAWTDETFNYSLQIFASQLFIIALIIFVCGSLMDLKGTLGTTIFRLKDSIPWHFDDDATQGKKKTQKKPKIKKHKKEYDQDENFYYQTVPRIPILPTNRYFAPVLQKNFPFETPSTEHIAPPIATRFVDLLDLAELSLQHRPFFDRLVTSISTMSIRNRTALASYNKDHEPQETKLPFGPVVERESEPIYLREVARSRKLTWADVLRSSIKYRPPNN